MVLPAGTTLPPLPYLLGVLGGGIAVAIALSKRDVFLETRTVFAFTPWMVAGSGLYVLYQIGAAPATARPLFSSPTVYATTAVVAGAAWVFASRFDATNRWLAGIGIVAAVLPIAAAVVTALSAGTFSPAWSLFGVIIGTAITVVLWRTLARYQPVTVARLGDAGAVAVLAHVLDGVSTAIGVDVLQFGEQTPLSALLLDVGASLPTAPYLGSGWLFLLVKSVLALGLVWVIADTVHEDPRLGNGLLLLITAVGLGPATHNLLLFAVAGPPGL